MIGARWGVKGVDGCMMRNKMWGWVHDGEHEVGKGERWGV